VAAPEPQHRPERAARPGVEAVRPGVEAVRPAAEAVRPGAEAEHHRPPVFMQENHSFDNYFGTRYGVNGFGDTPLNPPPVFQQRGWAPSPTGGGPIDFINRSSTRWHVCFGGNRPYLADFVVAPCRNSTTSSAQSRLNLALFPCTRWQANASSRTSRKA
jgi:Phosphoesterase family